MSLYGNNETLYKQVGDDLQAGDTIAAVAIAAEMRITVYTLNFVTRVFPWIPPNG